MRRTDDVSLWPWPLTLKLLRHVARVVEYAPANFDDNTTIRCRFMGYWAIGRGRASTDVSGPGQTSSLSIDPAAATVCCLYGGNSQITFSATKFLDLESDFRKFGSVAMLRSLIRILRASLVQRRYHARLIKLVRQLIEAPQAPRRRHKNGSVAGADRMGF